MGSLLRLRAWLLALAAASLLAGCGGGGGEDAESDGGGAANVDISAVAITSTVTDVRVGATVQLAAQAHDASGSVINGASLSWSSANTALATVNSAGLVTGVAAGGPVTIRVEAQGKAATVLLQVKPPLPPTASLEVSPASGAVPVGGELAVNAIARDAAGNAIQGASIAYQSSNGSIATVGANTGVINAVALGNATISIQSGQATASFAVTVVPQIAGKVDAGGAHACGLTKLGTAYCWGSNEYRQLGTDSTVEKSNVPLRVAGGIPFKDIAAGSRHTCALSLTGKAYCWGLNGNEHLLGDGDAATGSYVSTPFPVTTTQTFMSIDASNSQTCALTNDGDAYCWPRTLRASTYQSFATPTLIGGGLKFVSISVGSAHACGLTAQAKAYCWGWNYDQQLGTASYQQWIDDPVAVAGAHSFEEIAAGSSHTCARTSAGQVYCWGSDTQGLLGDGDAYAPGYTPRPIAGSHQIVSIGTGGAFTSAITASGAVLWWGSYTSDCGIDDIMSGDGCDYEDQASSPKGLGSYGFSSVSAGGMFNIGVTPDGRTGTWWYNNYGQLGGGSTAEFRTSPSIANIDFSLQAQTSLTVTPGRSISIPVTVQRTGGFTLSGIGLAEPIDLTLQAATGYNGSFQPSRVGPEQSHTTLTINPASNLQPGNTTLTIRGQATGGTVRTASMTATVPGAGGDGGGNLDLVCTSESTSLPSGYHCMRNEAGQLVPGRYSYSAMHGTWVDEVVGLCINWGSNGLATGRYKAPQLGGGSATTTPSGKWGVIVRRSGQPEGTSTMWYVFTAPLDPQTVLMGYDSSSNRILNGDFEKRSSCPW